MAVSRPFGLVYVGPLALKRGRVADGQSGGRGVALPLTPSLSPDGGEGVLLMAFVGVLVILGK